MKNNPLIVNYQIIIEILITASSSTLSYNILLVINMTEMKQKKRKNGSNDKQKKLVKTDKKEGEPEFEDIYEDEFEKEIEVDSSKIEQKPLKQVTAMFRDGVDELNDNYEMQYNSAAYSMLHQLQIPQSCLSLDFFKDDLGARRTKFPHELTLVAGSQASSPGDNYLYLFHADHLCKTKNDQAEESDSDEDSDTAGAENAVITSKKIKHWGSVNRVKTMPQTGVVASWSDTGKVYVYDTSAHLKQLNSRGFSSIPTVKASPGVTNEKLMPFFTFKGHSEEGYALDFSPVKREIFASGSCDKSIFVHTIKSDGTVSSSGNPFKSHTDSVEDIAFSPTESTVFATASVDKTIKIFDTRNPSYSHMLSFEAHSSDVNVLSWNSKVKYLLASGADEGDFKAWDLRMLKANDTKTDNIGYFNYHKAPITSIRWDFYDESVLSVACADNSVSVWDLSLEEEDALAALNSDMNSMKIHDKDGNVIVLPPQLLFLHQGIAQPKELSFHSQIPGLIGATSLDSIHLFICEPLDPRKSLLTKDT